MSEQVKYPNVRVKLSGRDGNAFAVLANVGQAMKRAGVSEAEISAFRKEAMSGDYQHLLDDVLRLGKRSMTHAARSSRLPQSVAPVVGAARLPQQAVQGCARATSNAYTCAKARQPEQGPDTQLRPPMLRSEQ